MNANKILPKEKDIRLDPRFTKLVFDTNCFLGQNGFDVYSLLEFDSNGMKCPFEIIIPFAGNFSKYLALFFVSQLMTRYLTT